ncbi:MAG: pilus assembly protein [Chloroflexi bacterium]|nr:pilus assembly protein [Chloroflexota bacterium]
MLKLIRKRKEKGEKGQALVEFALLVPIFLILLFAIVDFGMGFYSWITVTNSAREGARIGAVLANDQQIRDRVFDSAGLPNEGTNMEVIITNSAEQGGLPGQSVVVQVDYDYNLITPLANLLGGIIGPTLTLSSTAEMRLE